MYQVIIAVLVFCFSAFVEARCLPDQAKYMEMMEEKERCGGAGITTAAGLSLYTVLAEIAACEKYNIEQIGVIEKGRTRSMKPCVISLAKSSATVGYGDVEIKAEGKIHKIEWKAGYDLNDSKNDIAFWRSQLNPQIEKVFNPSSSSSGPQETSSQNTGSGKR